MATAMAAPSLSLAFNSKSLLFPSLHSPLSLKIRPRSNITAESFEPSWRKISAPKSNSSFLISEASQVEELVTADDGVSNVVSALLFIAFVGLSILTVGVIYIAVTDFLQKREGEKFEKEEASAAKKKKKKGGKKGQVVRAGSPRGFGQKIADEEEAN